MKYLLLFLSIVTMSVLAKAQTERDEVEDKISENRIRVDTSDKEAYVDTLGVGFWNKILAPTYPNPERAAAMSFIIPGAGQVYNKKFWYIKVPIIYAGYAFLINRGEEQRGLRNRFQEALVLQIAGEVNEFTGTRLGTVNALTVNRNVADKNFQLAYIGVAVLHFIQTLEAYTTGHLLAFDMDESLTISPTLLPSDPMGFGGSKPGVRIGFQLGR